MTSAFRKIVSAMLLATVAGAAAAEWVKVSANAAGTVYVDPATILRAGDRVTMWELTDFKIVSNFNDPYKSIKHNYQFDCQEMALRTLSIFGYAEKMADGDPVMAVKEASQWHIFGPGSIGEILWTIACRKPK